MFSVGQKPPPRTGLVQQTDSSRPRATYPYSLGLIRATWSGLKLPGQMKEE
jgi:hypothetical protein